MNTKESVRERLGELLAKGTLPRSGCSRAFLKQVDSLLQSGVLTEERSGSGRRIVVVDSAALGNLLAMQYPALPLHQGTLSREMALAKFRDTKALRCDTPEIISVRTWSDDALTFHDRSHAESESPRPPLFNAVEATRCLGVFSFLLNEDCGIQLNGKWGLVENPAAFAHFERLGLPLHGVLYTRGRVANRLLDWLASQPLRFEVLHLPDYDPSGLLDYRRLSVQMRERATLHIPDDLDARFERLSNPALLRKNMTRAMFASLRKSTQPEIQKVLSLIERHNGGLEQEALLINLK